MINQQQTEFIEALDGADLTPEQAAQLLELGGEGDTGGTTTDQSGAPNAAGAEPNGAATREQKDGDAKPVEGAPKPDPDDPSNTVILAKDGKHTIGYEKLVEARDEAKSWRQRAEDAQAQLDALKEVAAARAEAGEKPTQADTNAAVASAAIDKGADPAIFGDFTDEAIVKGITTFVKSQVGEQVGEILKAVDAKLAPFQQKQEASVEEAHFAAIYAKHADLDSLVESKQVQAWIDAQPSFTRQSYSDVFKKGTAQEVIELFDAFKLAQGTPAPTLPSGSVKAAAAVAIAKAQSEQAVPTSLTDLPGGRPGSGATRDEAWSQMDGVALLTAMQDASPEQIEKFLNRRV